MNEHVWMVLGDDEICCNRSAMARYKKDGWKLKEQPAASVNKAPVKKKTTSK